MFLNWKQSSLFVNCLVQLILDRWPNGRKSYSSVFTSGEQVSTNVPHFTYCTKKLGRFQKNWLHYWNGVAFWNSWFNSIIKLNSDYKEWLSFRHNGKLVSKTYYQKSMNFFRRKYETNSTSILFVMASDDIAWLRDMFGHDDEVVFVSTYSSQFASKQPIFDMAVLAQCNHSIIR